MAESIVSDNRPPFLLFNVGVRGAVHPIFSRTLADALGARYFSLYELRDTIKAERESGGRNRTVKKNQVDARFFGEAKLLLEQGTDVFADVPYNTMQSRRSTPLSLAYKTGAMAVALNLVTPRDSIRVVSGLARIDTILGQIERPKSSERGLGLIIDIDGRVPILGLVAQVEQQLDVHASRPVTM